MSGANMLLKINFEEVIFGMKINVSELPSLVDRYLINDKTRSTPELEENGKSLIANDFPERDLTKFIENICKWGGYQGIATRVLKQNQKSNLREKFVSAVNQLNNDPPNRKKALDSILNINQLNISFGSKHLRFLRPDICPALDKKISGMLGYVLNLGGYERFASDCQLIANKLEKLKINNPLKREKRKWYIADIEIALFQNIREQNKSNFIIK
jgi:hypothetical protein